MHDEPDWMIHFSADQRERFRTCDLPEEWRESYPELFDENDLRLARSQPSNHFYEWLTAIHLYETLGYRSLVEKYEFKGTHPAKWQLVQQILPPGLTRFMQSDDRTSGQFPDLLTYDLEEGDYFFCEVKGPGDRLSARQRILFEEIERLSEQRVRWARVSEQEEEVE